MTDTSPSAGTGQHSTGYSTKAGSRLCGGRITEQLALTLLPRPVIRTLRSCRNYHFALGHLGGRSRPPTSGHPAL